RGQVAPAPAASLTVVEVDRRFAAIAGLRGAGSGTAKRQAFGEMLARATALEQSFLGALVVRELRQGALDALLVHALPHPPPPRARRAAPPGGRATRAPPPPPRPPAAPRAGRGWASPCPGRCSRCSPSPRTPPPRLSPASPAPPRSSSSSTAFASRSTRTARPS